MNPTHATQLTPHDAGNRTQETRADAGFALLYTILIISIAVGLSSLILTSQTRQVKLVTTANQSTRAFYTADAVLECSLYLDRKSSGSAFPSSGGPADWPAVGAACPGTVKTSTSVGSDPVTYRFTLAGSNLCAQVVVKKEDAAANEPRKTTITARGYDDDCNNREVERVISTSY